MKSCQVVKLSYIMHLSQAFYLFCAYLNNANSSHLSFTDINFMIVFIYIYTAKVSFVVVSADGKEHELIAEIDKEVSHQVNSRITQMQASNDSGMRNVINCTQY